MHPVLVAAPDSSRFAPPVCFDRLSTVLVKAHLRMAAIGVGAWTLLACFALGLFLSTGSSQTGGYAVVLALMALAIGIDSFTSLRQVNGLKQRALFFFWLRSERSFKVALATWLAFVLVLGVVQLYFQERLGGVEPFIEAYGAVYADIRNGQFWRVATGPFFHSGLPHYLTNAVMVLFVGPLAWAVLGRASVLVFLVGNVTGVVMQMYLGSTAYDSFVGMSAGVFALFGLLIASSMLERGLLPKGFTLICAWIALISAVGTELLSASAATTAHVTGFATGAMCAWVCKADSLKGWFS